MLAIRHTTRLSLRPVMAPLARGLTRTASLEERADIHAAALEARANLATAQAQLGETHPTTLRATRYLASLLTQLGDEEALEGSSMLMRTRATWRNLYPRSSAE